jgi:hypothetical protein
LAALVLRAEADGESSTVGEREAARLRRLAHRAEVAAGFSFGEAFVYVKLSHVESEALPLERVEYVPPRPLVSAGRRAA